MKKNIITVSIIILLFLLPLLFNINKPKGSVVYAEECLKCSDVGCNGGNVGCAVFECRGTKVLCLTTPPHN